MTTRLAVIGLGYVGLPLAQAATEGGLHVVGLDRDPQLASRLNRGQSHIDDLPDESIREMVRKGFTATTDGAVVAGADVVVICVPTPLTADGKPDLAPILAAASNIAKHLKPHQLIVLESTTFPGTTEEILLPLFEERGLKVGKDFHLAFSPERIDPGNAIYGIRNTAKVVGGVTHACTEKAAAFYRLFIETVVQALGTREAETAKLLENTYRNINIALVNEMARFCNELKIDLWNVISCAATKPFGFQAFFPGPGVGGHCIPIDPNYLSYHVKSRLGYPFKFVELAQEVNATMPQYVARRIQDILNRDAMAIWGASILLVGVTYKKDIADERESPAVSVARHLLALGAIISYHDPYVSEWRVGNEIIPRAHSLCDAAALSSVVVVLQHHEATDLSPLVVEETRVFDTRGILRGTNVERL